MLERTVIRPPRTHNKPDNQSIVVLACQIAGALVAVFENEANAPRHPEENL
jgi:hypothetical protein